MKKIRGSIAAKVVAWILISVSAVCFLGSAVILCFFVDKNVYGQTQEETRREWFAEVSNRYAIYAVKNLENNQNEDFFKDKNFQYGIIKAKSLNGLDLNAEKTYVERNFSQQISQNDIEVNTISFSGTENLVCENIDSFFDGYAYVASNDWSSHYADGIYYDTAGGIFYYYADGMYYPVQSVEIESRETSVYYDFDKKMYKNEWAHTEYSEETEEVAADTADTTIAALTDTAGKAADTEEVTDTEFTSAEQVFNQRYMTFDMLDQTDLNVSDMGMLMFDGVREINALEIKRFNSKNLSPDVFTNKTEYYLNQNYTLMVKQTKEEEKTDYVVVSIMPKSVGTGWDSADLYVQANAYLQFAYNMRYTVFVLLFAFFTVGLLCFVYLMGDAGHRKGTEEITQTIIDRLPLDIYGVLTLIAEIFLLAVAVDGVMNSGGPYVLYGIIYACIVLCMGWILLTFLLSCSVRAKAGKWWQNTFFYQVFYRFFAMLWTNIELLWKAVLIMAGLAAIEFSGLLIFSVRGEAVLFWFLEKCILYPVILIAFVQMKKIKDGTERIAAGAAGYKIQIKGMLSDFREHGDTINHISEGMTHAVEEQMKSERFKTELITNVSHDIKTPLTSIINYVDLLEKEDLQNENAIEYLEVLERQSARLKKLIEDLMEASKASTGNLKVHLEKLEAGIFMVQTVGEFEEKTSAAGLELVIEKPEQPVYIMADSRHFWRVIDNLMNNICKYAQKETRVYINLEVKNHRVYLTFRNTSKYALNISSEELMERFVRGDSSRNTEGSGLGLSIATSLMEIMDGNFKLYVDGDLFKVVLEFAEAKQEEANFNEEETAKYDPHIT